MKNIFIKLAKIAVVFFGILNTTQVFTTDYYSIFYR